MHFREVHRSIGSVFHTVFFRSTVAMDLSSLPNDELARSLGSIQRRNRDVVAEDNLEDLVQELQVHRVELEMQNRALRETELEIESALQRYSDLYDHLPIGYITVTPSGRIVQANLTAAGWLRRDRTQLIGGYFNWFLDAFDAGRFSAHVDSCVQTGCEQTLELTLRFESGLSLAAQLTSRLAPQSASKGPQINTAITNISQLKQAHAVAADIAREDKDFSESITGEIHASVDTVSKFARTILEEHAAELNDSVKSMVERMECAAMRLEATLRNLVEYCLGHDDAVLDPVSLEELMQHVMMEQRAIIERRNADITVQRPLPCVRGARLVLGHVLSAVLSHVLQTRRSEPPRVRITAVQEGGEVELTVHDESTPSGMPPDARNFPLREHPNPAGWFSGTGVGLSVIRRTIERMKGRVWVEANVGQATSLHIRLPSV
jgi:signal transduction histidine kinase